MVACRLRRPSTAVISMGMEHLSLVKLLLIYLNRLTTIIKYLGGCMWHWGKHTFTPLSVKKPRKMLTHWDRDKMAAIFQTTFSNAFSWMKMCKFWLRFLWGLFTRVQLTILQHWFRKWLGAVQATSHYLNQWWLVCWRIYGSLGLNVLVYLRNTQRHK